MSLRPKQPRKRSSRRALPWASLVLATLLALATSGPAHGESRGGSALPPDGGAVPTSAGCGSEPTLTSGTHQIESDGQVREFILDVPEGYDPDHPYRLVLGLHWWGATAEDVATGQTVDADTWAYYGLKRLAEESTIFVAPQGHDNGWANTGGEDVVFVDDILDVVEDDLCVDTSQRFALGFSYGGAMSYALACARADVFRAVAVYGAPRDLSGCSGGTEPVAYFAAHGIEDNIASGAALRDTFVRNNGCTPQDPPAPAPGSLTHVTTSYAGCSAGHPVVWAAFDGGHIAAPQDGAPGDSGANTWLPGETWDFFTQEL